LAGLKCKGQGNAAKIADKKTGVPGVRGQATRGTSRKKSRTTRQAGSKPGGGGRTTTEGRERPRWAGRPTLTGAAGLPHPVLFRGLPSILGTRSGKPFGRLGTGVQNARGGPFGTPRKNIKSEMAEMS